MNNSGIIAIQNNRFWQYLVGSIGLTLSLQSIADAHTGVGIAAIVGAAYLLVNH